MAKTKLNIICLTLKKMLYISMVILTACSGSENTTRSILPKNTKIISGDIVLRKGTGLTSRAVTLADGGSDYSHCGIVVDSCGFPMIIHAVPDEPDFDGDVDRVKMEHADSFFSSVKSSKGCVLRCDNRSIAIACARLAEELYRRHTLFDNEYDDRDTTKMYCSELVEYVYSRCGINLINGIRHDVSLPGMKFSHVIFPSDFIKSKQLHIIAHF